MTTLNLCPESHNICYVRGDTAPFGITVTDANGAAVDITGYTFELTVDPEENPTASTNNLFTIAGTITDAANGGVTFQLSLAQSDQIPAVYYYDIQMTDASLDESTIAKGTFEFKQDISK